MIAEADLSPCGGYRWFLARTWNTFAAPLRFLMLNPSTANANRDDPTVTRCIDFAARLGHGGIAVYNLFALRSTDPYELLAVDYDHAVGELNDRRLDEIGQEMVVCAWGVKTGPLGRLIEHRARQVMLRRTGPAACLGIGANGHPRHPLMMPAHSRLEPFHMPWEAPTP